jgi:hypothetical protein
MSEGARVDNLGSVYKYRDAAGLSHYNAEIYADETSDIAGKTTFEGDKVADPNSTAYVIRTGKLYVMSGDNKWYDTDGNEVE